MGTIAGQPTGSRRIPDAPDNPVRAFKPGDPPKRDAREHGGKLLFEIPFTSVLTGTDMELLARRLDLASHADRKLPVNPNSPAVARLDGTSTLTLKRGEDEDRWLLEARSWGTPSTRAVHRWHVHVAVVAHQLDSSVQVPERIGPQTPEPPLRPVGKASSGRLSHLRRRLVGLP